MSNDSDIQALLAKIKSGNVVDTSSQQNSHIGVPNNYRPPLNADLYGGVVDTPGQRPWSESQMGMARGTVRYKPGDEDRPVNTPQLIPQLQSQLVQLGYLNVKNVAIGRWGSAERTAYRKLLGEANNLGLNAQDAIEYLLSRPTLGQIDPNIGKKHAPRAPLVVEETNPLDIAATAQSAAQQLLGRSLTDKELEPFIANYQSVERGAQQKAYKIGGTGKDATIVKPPSSDALTEDYFKKNYLPEETGYAAVQRMNDFYSLLGGK